MLSYTGAQWIYGGAFGCLVLGLGGVITTSVVLNTPAAVTMEPLGHMVVADAGSTHTEFMLYQWTAPCKEYVCNETALFGTLARQIPFSCDLRPGISSQTPEQVDEVVRTCLGQAAGNLSSLAWHKTPFNLRATAGMRLLNYTNASESDAVLQAVVEASDGTPFSNANMSNSAAILSGEDEGAFSWACANYLKHTLQPALAAVHEAGPLALGAIETVGALDLGGASTQITFVPAAGTQWDPQDKSTLRLYGQELELYTHSYLCYGQVQMTKRRHAMLINLTDTSAASVVDPCLPSGYSSQEWSAEDLTDLLTNPCVGFTFSVEAFTGKNLTGGGSASACNATTVEAMFENYPLPPNGNTFSEAVARMPAIPDNMQIYAVSSYWYTANFLFPTRCTVDDSCNPSLDEFAAAGETICALDIDALRAEFPGVKDKYLVENCQNTQYIVNLLERYNVARDSTNIHFANTLDGVEVGWAFGFALNSTAAIMPVEINTAPSVGGQHAAKGGLAAAIIVVFVSVVALYLVRQRMAREGDYESLN